MCCTKGEIILQPLVKKKKIYNPNEKWQSKPEKTLHSHAQKIYF